MKQTRSRHRRSQRSGRVDAHRRRRADGARARRRASAWSPRGPARAHRRVDHRAPRLRPARETWSSAGWDLQFANVYEGALHHKVLPRARARVRAGDKLEAITPWPARLLSCVREKSPVDKNVVRAERHPRGDRHPRAQHRGLQEGEQPRPRGDGEPRVDRALPRRAARARAACARSRQGSTRNDPAITPAMRYFYAANKLGIPYCNFTPSLTNVPALAEPGREDAATRSRAWTARRARRCSRRRWRSMFRVAPPAHRGLVLDELPRQQRRARARRTRLEQDQGAVEGVRSSTRSSATTCENHQVHIHYYKPRGDSKEAWDNIDIVGFAGVPMQIKVNFLCQDSALAAPLVLDLVRLLDVAKRAGESGIQRQLSIFFKSPYAAPKARRPCTISSSRRSCSSTGRRHSARRQRPNGHRPAPEIVGVGRRTPSARRGRRSRSSAARRSLERGAHRGLADRRATRSGAPSIACSIAASCRARTRRRRRRSSEEFAQFVGAQHCPADALRDQRAPCSRSRRRASARATRSSSPRTASWRRRSRRCRRAPSRCSPTWTPQTGCLDPASASRGDDVADARDHARAHPRRGGGHARPPRRSRAERGLAPRRGRRAGARRDVRRASRSARSAPPAASRCNRARTSSPARAASSSRTTTRSPKTANAVRNFGQDVALADAARYDTERPLDGDTRRSSRSASARCTAATR